MRQSKTVLARLIVAAAMMTLIPVASLALAQSDTTSAPPTVVAQTSTPTTGTALRSAPKKKHHRHRRTVHFHPAFASWYGPGFYGNHLGCGGRYYPGNMGVAHKTLPCGTRLRICYRRCVTATVQDRGPYVGGRDFDLQVAVKQRVGFPGLGTIHWRIIHKRH